MALRAGDLRKQLEGIDDDTIICVLGFTTAEGIVDYGGSCEDCGERSLVITSARNEEEYEVMVRNLMKVLEGTDAKSN